MLQQIMAIFTTLNYLYLAMYHGPNLFMSVPSCPLFAWICYPGAHLLFLVELRIGLLLAMEKDAQQLSRL